MMCTSSESFIKKSECSNLDGTSLVRVTVSTTPGGDKPLDPFHLTTLNAQHEQ
jgi:hypothetical protein